MAAGIQLVGVDGARAGWIAVYEAGESMAYGVFPDPVTLVRAFPNAWVLSVDMPIGLADSGPRSPDSLARRFVGGRRACSIFSAPVRCILDAQSQPEASLRHRAIDGRGFGAQAFAILPKIRDWDALLLASSTARERVYEVHPEVSFAALNGGVGLVAGKKTREGALLRTNLLSTEFGREVVEGLLASVPRREAAPDDVLDALVAFWSARRISSGSYRSLPSPPERDSCGLRMAIHY
ncbi:MAG: DUF429 domain-containing protein [Dokdonella sp.]